ncbi:MAG: hypothetical protein PHP54_04960 [Clostridia bacterium]|nr:hypothetical protein [Clostridia bacterium]
MNKLDKELWSHMICTCADCTKSFTVYAEDVQCDCILESGKGFTFYFYTLCIHCGSPIGISEVFLSKALQESLCFKALDRYCKKTK